MFTELFRILPDLGLLAQEGTMRGHLIHPFWSYTDENLHYFKAFNEWHSTTLLGNCSVWLKLLNSHWNLDCRLLVLSGLTGRLDTTLMALIMPLIFIQAKGLELFWLFPGVILTLMLSATLSGCSGEPFFLPYIHVYFPLYYILDIFQLSCVMWIFLLKVFM